MVLDNSLAAEVRRYREGMARSLANLAGMVAETERSLSAQGLDLDSIDLESELTSEKARRMHCTTCGLLLRKGKIHMVGAYRANETDNLHSLAVQMRPVLECAGQAHDMGLIAMGGLEHGGKKALARLDTYYSDTMLRVTKGSVSKHQLFSQIAEMRKEFGMDGVKPKSFRHESKAESLRDGKVWYHLLGKYFCGTESVFEGLPSQGSVALRNPVWDNFTFAEFMAYLVEQAAKMNMSGTILAEGSWTTAVQNAVDQIRNTIDDISGFRERISEEIEGHGQ